VAVEAQRITVGGLEFSYLAQGEGPLALCLHGFPDSAHTWAKLLPALAARGFRAVAPWMRGFAPTEVPSDGRYQGGALVGDAIALHEAFGGDGQAVIIGHDWGAMAAYGAGAYAPERWRRVVALSIPPLALTSQALSDYDHLRRFWYQFFFLHPVAEDVVAANDLAFIDRLWADWSPGLEAGPPLEQAKAALRPEGHLAAALGYYRAMYDPSAHAPELAELQRALLEPTSQPTLYLHGQDDGCVSADLGQGAEAYLGSGSRRVVIPDTGHFLHLEEPGAVIREIVDFVGADAGVSTG
jgi:pimeloyl-ACP methyl ester carboxylesterase